jgi:hypothetical protein
MRHVVISFQTHVGERGCHFYSDEGCEFLAWDEVFTFLRAMPELSNNSTFSDRLIGSLANYDPDYQFLAVKHTDDTVSVELYSDLSHHLEGKSYNNGPLK